jgi:hypothetical protein
MNELKTLQLNLLNYLLHDDGSIFDSITSVSDDKKLQQIQINKNAYSLRLKEAIDTDHSQLGFYLGDDIFDQVVAGYIEKYPSSYTSLRHFCDNMPQFLTDFEPLQNVPVAAEFAAFERILMTAFDAQDSNFLCREDLQNIVASDWAAVIFRFHPSVQCITFQWNTVDIWQAMKEGVIPPAPIQQENHWLIWRNKDRLTEFRAVTHQEHQLIDLVLAGNDFANLCSFLSRDQASDDIGSLISSYIFTWVDNQLLRSYSV